MVAPSPEAILYQVI